LPLALAGLAAPVGVLAGVNPEAAIVAALALAFVLIVFVDLATGVVLFTLLIFFGVLPGFSGGAFAFTKVAGLLLAISWLAVLATRNDAKADVLRQHPMVSAALILFLAWAGLSYTWAELPGSAAEAWSRLVLNGILFLIVYTAVRTSRDAILVLAAFVLGATAAALYGILSGVDVGPYGEVGRLAGESQNANELASTLVASLALAVGLAFVARKSPVLRFVALMAASLSMAGILLTVSRSGMVALAVTALAAIVFAGRWRAGVALISTLVVISAVGYFAFLAPPEARERVTTVEGGTGREDIWTVAWRMVEANPVRGVGAGNFQTSSIHYLLAPGTLTRSDFIISTQKVAHNVYLGTAAELGAVGLTLFVSLILLLLGCSIQAIRQFERNGDQRMEILARAHLVALVGLLVSLFFASDEYKKQLWLLLALCPALLALARAGARPGASD
jgi:putative inorganic carbon (HCO3(-)) transporter